MTIILLHLLLLWALYFKVEKNINKSPFKNYEMFTLSDMWEPKGFTIQKVSSVQYNQFIPISVINKVWKILY
jgi:hypothetical protein